MKLLAFTVRVATVVLPLSSLNVIPLIEISTSPDVISTSSNAAEAVIGTMNNTASNTRRSTRTLVEDSVI